MEKRFPNWENTFCEWLKARCTGVITPVHPKDADSPRILVCTALFHLNNFFSLRLPCYEAGPGPVQGRCNAHQPNAAYSGMLTLQRQHAVALLVHRTIHTVRMQISHPPDRLPSQHAMNSRIPWSHRIFKNNQFTRKGKEMKPKLQL